MLFPHSEPCGDPFLCNLGYLSLTPLDKPQCYLVFTISKSIGVVAAIINRTRMNGILFLPTIKSDHVFVIYQVIELRIGTINIYKKLC